ncbi:hypothetical protein ACLQ20_11945 [Micromonospora sp. DT46]|uniref:hypothetical protein n=1 Tax=Micromonospora sp. DT46 TaxID=3393435 RepID=UPI003CECB832
MQAGYDGTFRSGPLAGRTVNVKAYGDAFAGLDISPHHCDHLPDPQWTGQAPGHRAAPPVADLRGVPSRHPPPARDPHGQGREGRDRDEHSQRRPRGRPSLPHYRGARPDTPHAGAGSAVVAVRVAPSCPVPPLAGGHAQRR